MFEDTKGLIRSCNSKDIQHNDQKKNYKMTNNDQHKNNGITLPGIGNDIFINISQKYYVSL
jgi:hypothetical protein